MKDYISSALSKNKIEEIRHANPNCKNSKYCREHGETGNVDYDWERLNKDLERLSEQENGR